MRRGGQGGRRGSMPIGSSRRDGRPTACPLTGSLTTRAPGVRLLIEDVEADVLRETTAHLELTLDALVVGQPLLGSRLMPGSRVGYRLMPGSRVSYRLMPGSLVPSNRLPYADVCFVG